MIEREYGMKNKWEKNEKQIIKRGYMPLYGKKK